MADPVADPPGRLLTAEVAHWRIAAEALADLEVAASPTAWAGLEEYLQRGVRDRLRALVTGLVHEATALERLSRHGADPARVRAGLLTLRRRYLQAETIVDFYGDAVNSRTDGTTAALLRGLDTLAGDSLAASLVPLGIEPPPALVYVDKGLGASILRAGIRLWDQAHPSPAAAVKVTRHNLTFPTALLHETGHQVGHLTGWNAELAAALHAVLEGHAPDVAQLWRGWASEVAADVHAFAQAGWAPLAALANVVDGSTDEVFRLRLGDPHPYAWIRVLFNAALCRDWFGAGPWDDVARAWVSRHPVSAAGPELERVSRISVAALPQLAQVCLRQPMRSWGGAPVAARLDPRRVGPQALAALERRAGPSLLTSTYLRRREGLRILALLSTRAVLDPDDAATHRRRLHTWLTAAGADGTPRPLRDRVA